jgi:L-malate glycosyltransferase
MEIHQVVVAASPGDAVTNAAFAFRTLLERIAPSEIYARYLDPRLAGEVHPLHQYQGGRDSARNILVYHASIGEPDVAAFLLGRPEHVVLVYHNITPPEYFTMLDPPFARLLAGGRAELMLLRGRVELALAVSAYNAAELESFGYEDVRVSPLPLEVQSLRTLEPDPATVKRLARDEGPIVLFVGQLLPHKRPDLLLQAFHVLVTYLLPEAHLKLVGPTRQTGYRRALEGLVEELNVDAHITDWVSPEALAALYGNATCFVTMSEHEGVCVPLLEAMALDLPVLARSFAAIPETMGDAGLLLPADDDPLLVAEAMCRLLTDEQLRAELVARGRKRLADFDPTVAQATFLSHIGELV